MRGVVILVVGIFCWVVSCKPLARQEAVSEEQSIAASLTQHFDKGQVLGKFAGLRGLMDGLIAKGRVYYMESFFNHKLIGGRSATIKEVFDAYIEDDLARVGKTMVSIGSTSDTGVVRRHLRELRVQVDEVRNAWDRRTKTLSAFSKQGTPPESHMDRFVQEYRLTSDKYKNWAEEAEKNLENSLRKHAALAGHPVPNDLPLHKNIEPPDLGEMFSDLKRRLRLPQNI